MQSAKFILLGVVLVAFLAASLVKAFREPQSPPPKPLPRAETLIKGSTVPNGIPEYVDISLSAVNLTALPFKTGLYVQGPDQQLQSIPLENNAERGTAVTAETIDGKLLLYTENRAKTLALDMLDSIDLRVLLNLQNEEVQAQLSDASTEMFPAGYVLFYNLLEKGTHVLINDQKHKVEPGQHVLVDVRGERTFNFSCVIDGQETPAIVRRYRLPEKCRITICLANQNGQAKTQSIVERPPNQQTASAIHQN